MRQLKDRVKDKYVVQFLLDREFFINNSEDTIYKNSQLKSSNNWSTFIINNLSLL